MIYVSAILTVLSLYFLNTSLMPHFWLPTAQIILVLPFISIYSLRDKSIFPYMLAVFAGLLYDSATISDFPVFAVVLLMTTLLGKNVFSKITSYGIVRTSLLLTVIGYFAILLADWERVFIGFAKAELYLGSLVTLSVLIIIHFLLSRFMGKYFDWVEKTTSERYR